MTTLGAVARGLSIVACTLAAWLPCQILVGLVWASTCKALGCSTHLGLNSTSLFWAAIVAFSLAVGVGVVGGRKLHLWLARLRV